jgi:hypothetical protein
VPFPANRLVHGNEGDVPHLPRSRIYFVPHTQRLLCSWANVCRTSGAGEAATRLGRLFVPWRWYAYIFLFSRYPY